jgi:transcriptional regulator with XRE-family HTH domain
MNSNLLSPRKRNRGVVLTAQGWQRLQESKQNLEWEHNWGQRFTREEISERSGLALNTVSRILNRGEPVDKQSLAIFLNAFGLELSQGDCILPVSPFQEWEARYYNPCQDWKDAIDVSVFYGREMELAQLQRSILTEHCRLVTLLGIGGIGKSSLAVKLGLQVQSEFRGVVWRSLQHAPSLEVLLDSILQFLAQVQEEKYAPLLTLDRQMLKLIDDLQSSRYLLILDGVEPVLEAGKTTGHYRSGYADYGQLFQAIGTVPHRSCVVLTSREQPREIARLAGEDRWVQTLHVTGLNTAESRALFQPQEKFSGTAVEWQQLITYYGGNSLWLKQVGAMAQALFNGRIGEILPYITQGAIVCEEIHDRLTEQFRRLSDTEQKVMFWLAIHREPISIATLSANVITLAARNDLPTALHSLTRRSLVERKDAAEQFYLQPLIQDYVTQQLVMQVGQELCQLACPMPTQHLRLNRHALIKASVDRIQAMQVRFILQPILAHLLTELGTQAEVKRFLQARLQEHDETQPGYLKENLVNLLRAGDRL